MRDIFGHCGSLLFGRTMGVGTDYSVRGVAAGICDNQSGMLMVPLWTPAQLTTAQWLDVSDTSTLTLDGSAISQAADQSGSSRHATMTGTSRPTLSGGMAVFDGVNDYMNISVPQASPSHVFAVIDTTVLGTGLRAFLDRTIGSSPYPPALYLGTNTQPHRPSIYWGTSVALSDLAARQQLMILEFRIGPSVVGVRANGGTEKTETTGQSVLSTWTSLNTQNTYGQQAAFSLGEAIIVNSALSDADRQRVEGYLAHKWGLAASLSADHPYKSAPPTI